MYNIIYIFYRYLYLKCEIGNSAKKKKSEIGNVYELYI